jgi:hypothetical protein
MKTQQLDYFVHYADCTFSGYGHYKVKVILADESYIRFKEFYHTTTDMRGIDESKYLEGQDRYEYLYDLIKYDIKYEVEEWLQEFEP